MVILYIGAGINHFVHPKAYLRIMPPYLPAHQFLIYASGIAEITLGILLLLKTTQRFAAWSIALMLVLFLSVHIYMLQQSLRHESYYITPAIAWLRLLLQPVLIAWALWYAK